MQIVIVNHSKTPLKEASVQKVFDQICKKLIKVASLKNKNRLKKSEITLVFVASRKIQELNRRFRYKDYATDVLSFAPSDNHSLGELVFCPPVLKKQARQNGHSFDDELLYMLIHGVLHLLGYDHEASLQQEKKMFFLQDRLFSQLTDEKIKLNLTYVNRSRT